MLLGLCAQCVICVISFAHCQHSQVIYLEVW